jgi:uncharacterized protein (TIRG00374 family)
MRVSRSGTVSGRRAPADRARATHRWTAQLFLSPTDAHYSRRASDVVRVIGGAVTVGVLVTVAATGHAVSLHHVRLPDLLHWVLVLFPWLGLAVPGLVVMVGVVADRRWKLAASVVIAAGLAAALLALVDSAFSIGQAVAATAAWGAVMAAWPQLRRPLRRWFVVGELGLLALLLVDGTASLVGAALAAAVGFTSGSLLRVAAGTAAGDPVAAMLAAVSELGLDLRSADPLPGSGPGSGERYAAALPDGTGVVVAVYGRDYVQAQVLYGLIRFAWYRGSHLPATASRLQYLEHHLALILQANTSGASDTHVVAFGLAGPTSDAVMVSRHPDEVATLASIVARSAEPTAVLIGADDLDGAWAKLASLIDGDVAHGAISPTTVLRRDDGGWLFDDLRSAVLAPDRQRVLADQAALLVVTAKAFGTEAAVAAARRALGPDGLAAVVPLLQPHALPRESRIDRRKDKALLGDLRVAASQAAGIEPPQLAALARVSPVTLAMVAGTFLGLWILVGELTGISNVGNIVAGANWWWLLPAFVLGLSTDVTEASALAGAVAEPLSLGPLIMLRLADGFLGLVGGTVATTAAAIRFFQLRGLSAAIAVSSGLLYSVSGFIDQMVLSLVALLFAHDAFNFSTRSSSTSGSSGGHPVEILLLVIVGILVIAGIVLARPRFRRLVMDRLRPQVAGARDNLRDLAGNPTKYVQLFGSNMITQVLFALSLGLCLEAFGVHVGIGVLILVNTAAALLGGIAPIPGGMGVIEAGLIAGLTAAGVPQDQAVAGTFAYRLITAYLPPIWGWPAMIWLRRHEYL